MGLHEGLSRCSYEYDPHPKSKEKRPSENQKDILKRSIEKSCFWEAK